MKIVIEKIFYLIALVLNLKFVLKIAEVFKYLRICFWGAMLKAKARFVEGRVLIDTPCRLNIKGLLSIGDNFIVGKGLRMEVLEGELIIGKNVQFEDNCHIGCANKISIGDGCLLASRVYIADHSHGDIIKTDLPPMQRAIVSKGGVEIGRNVWIGEGASILPGVVLGDNCIVGAGAVVTKSFPSNVVLAGIPAKVIKEL